MTSSVKASCRSARPGRWIGQLCAVTLLMIAILPSGLAQASPRTRYVDQSNPSCSNSGSGSASQPYCTIGAAASAAVAGDTVLVSAGTYVEDVTPSHSGTAGLPITFQPNGSAVVTISGKANGFSISGKSWIIVRGFTVADTTSYGIYISGSNNITITDSRVTSAGTPTSGNTAYGFKITNTSNSTIRHNTVDHNSDSGIDVVNGSTGIVIDGNSSFNNAREFTRAAAGIDILSAGNTVINNICHDNEDSGINARSSGANNLIANNIVYRNGDHGIDISKPTGQLIVSNTVYKNTTSGINVEGGATATIANNISADNGINSPRSKGDFRIDDASAGGTTLDYDLVYLSSSSPMFVWKGSNYSSLIQFRNATGQEQHGTQGDPKFVKTTANDYHLLAGSPAIDSADSGAGGEQTTDSAGAPRYDDPGTSNTGAGPRAFDDRGAFEFGANGSVDNPPVAGLSVTPPSGTIPDNAHADASSSTDNDATPIASYNFDWGDGTSTGAQASPTADHQYPVIGDYTVTVTVTDTANLTGTATQQVHALADNPPSAALTVTPPSGTIPYGAHADASASTDSDATGIATYNFDWGDGTSTGAQASPTADHQYLVVGDYTVTVTVTDTANLTGTATQQVHALVESPPNAQLTVTPYANKDDHAVLADASASTDNDSTGIATYNFDWGDGTSTGAQAGSTATHHYASNGSYTVVVTVTDTAALSSQAQSGPFPIPEGPPTPSLTVTPPSGSPPLPVHADASQSTDGDSTGIQSYKFDWGDGTSDTGWQASPTADHTYAANGTYTLTVAVQDSAGLSASTSKTVTVSSSATNFVGNPGFETNTSGWSSSSGATLTRVAGGNSGGWSAQLTVGSTTADDTLNDSPNWVTTTTGATYTGSIWVRTDATWAGKTLKLRFREYQNGSTLQTQSSTVTLSTSWQKVVVTLTPLGAGQSNIDFNALISSAAPGTTFYVDDASISTG